jgi:hypothetical protein
MRLLADVRPLRESPPFRRGQVLAGAFLADLNATVLGLPVALFPAINAERFGGGADSRAADGRDRRRRAAGSAVSGPVGTVGSLASPTISALSGGLATIAGVILLWLALPSFARYDARQPAPADRLAGKEEPPASTGPRAATSTPQPATGN